MIGHGPCHCLCFFLLSASHLLSLPAPLYIFLLMYAGFPCPGPGSGFAASERVSPGWEQSHAACPHPSIWNSLHAGDRGPLILGSSCLIPPCCPLPQPFNFYTSLSFWSFHSFHPSSSAVFSSGRSRPLWMLAFFHASFLIHSSLCIQRETFCTQDICY